MRILLINPSLRQATTGQYEKELEEQRGIYPPLGLAYIAAILEKNDYQVTIIDCDTETNYRDKIQDTCYELKPQIVGFYAMTWSYILAKEIATQVKNIDKKIITILGGPNVTSMPHSSLKLGEFDFGVLGEGEKTIIELLEKIDGKKNIPYEKILGLAFKKDEAVIVNGLRPLINDLDTLPYPARHLLPIKKYFDVFSQKKHFATIIATRGCPFNCVFCDRQNRMGRNWRRRSPINIALEIKAIRDIHGIKEFMFFDDNIIIDKVWALQLCKEIKKLNIAWECRERVDMVDEDVLLAMKKSGCYRIRFGFESGDNNVLNTLKKGIRVEQSIKCAEICKKVGIEVYGYFMIGAPNETPDTINKTINLSLKMQPSFAIFSKTILIPGSDLFEYGVKTNQIRRDYWERYLAGIETNGAPSLTKEKLSETEIDNFVKLADRKFYLRPNFIIKRILRTKNLTHIIRQAKMGIALIFKNTKKEGLKKFA
ncbi:MAG: hypothetical protein COU81_03535 [Candidatus Portnoybacteria bacterium CG10_big_fil_rev_8_21_14_0_10_36_7]|uniref:Uncharacterized protein n=1 Tax=Candidatus Portnoybacteria bacterium CG10_big_fil_rev_8_21_14_0_10_36_7 TaxID=1974812 RepID=A0A2M8KDA8_9BACT|nr:MAG: hypothetical protein COU81_03535 [Candidatus Portnoybacteria bacterium CG10_big_fil_rev_8_21_14_0_10_36_7]